MRLPVPIAICAILFFLIETSASGGVAEGEAALQAGDIPRAIGELTPAAEKGDAVAQLRLAFAYEALVALNFRDAAASARYRASAFTWSSRAAEQNVVSAQRRVAQLLRAGGGAPVDVAKADEWDRRANAILRERAENGDAAAQEALASAYSLGQGVLKDPKEATKWRRAAGGQGYAEAINALGVQYGRGDGVQKDPALAYAFFVLASRITRGKGEDDIGYRENQDGLAAGLSREQKDRALAIADEWRPGVELPESSDKN
ncbi:hypothetical protein A1351_14420 [Methylosinus sp. R-45379]|uniref:tetratricopeptide repeat protein n=1 Tax=unclassified Methylosinus TaxID=2624500 RepID=UPI00047ED061|nr:MULTISPECIES: tetratricopeptide repeat protein [unclassified Methylosinus]OAI26752.1 hypothetical protein A1351_14420 [Methylosinus sp. R-45379]TDX67510.1 TPR repeat protein [Methylosinus sp. sav-2]